MIIVIRRARDIDMGDVVGIAAISGVMPMIAGVGLRDRELVGPVVSAAGAQFSK